MKHFKVILEEHLTEENIEFDIKATNYDVVDRLASGLAELIESRSAVEVFSPSLQKSVRPDWWARVQEYGVDI